MSKEIRKLARERVGTVKPAFSIRPKTDRKRPKHKKSWHGETDEIA